MMRTPYRKARNAAVAVRSWAIPYLGSRMRPNELRPLLAWLFTDWKCNLACDYCYTYDNKLAGMTLETAKKSIDWLHSTGCRVVALMGGEPLVRKKFVLDVVEYGANKGMFMYLPTNGRLLDAPFLKSAADAGLSALNLAIDCMEPQPGLPKSFRMVEKQYELTLAERNRSDFLFFINVNVTPRNFKDARQIAERVWPDEVGIDFHASEPPIVKLPESCSFDEKLAIHQGATGVSEFFVWLQEMKKERLDKGMILNSGHHIAAMKKFAETGQATWPSACRAGINSLAIRLDGTLATCFECYHDKRRDWGEVGAPKFDREALVEQKKDCSKHCVSTTNYAIAYHYQSLGNVIEWVSQHAY